MVKMPLKRKLKSNGNYIVVHGKSWKNHGIVFLNFCWNPVIIIINLLMLRDNTYFCFSIDDTHLGKKTVCSKPI